MADPHATPALLTVEEWAQLDEDVEGELVDGHLEEEEVPSYAHEIVVSWLIRYLSDWLVPRGGFVLASETKLKIGPRRGRKPDLVLFFPDRPLPRRRASLGVAPPDVAIEVVTPTPRDGRRDRIEKRRDYAAAKVPQYWIVDPELRALEVYALQPTGRYADALSASEGAHPVPGCEGLVLDLDALWAELDRWPDEDDSAPAD
ncbi:MAG: Uma2 family endonuclease [Sandaracinaceae bacterium]|nr:Uma2 family endonuclease [Sandaracinaceae bacterium]